MYVRFVFVSEYPPTRVGHSTVGGGGVRFWFDYIQHNAIVLFRQIVSFAAVLAMAHSARLNAKLLEEQFNQRIDEMTNLSYGSKTLLKLWNQHCSRNKCATKTFGIALSFTPLLSTDTIANTTSRSHATPSSLITAPNYSARACTGT